MNWNYDAPQLDFALARKPRTFRRADNKKFGKKNLDLRIENLEDRVTPATFTWTGLTSSDWNVVTNWQGSNKPTGNAAAVENLVFPVTGLNQAITNFNNAVDGSYDSIKFTGGTYTISGSATMTIDVSAIPLRRRDPGRRRECRRRHSFDQCNQRRRQLRSRAMSQRRRFLQTGTGLPANTLMAT